MISMFYLGQIPGSFFWGWFADHYGRKAAMISIIGGIIFIDLIIIRKYALYFWFRLFKELLLKSFLPLSSWYCRW